MFVVAGEPSGDLHAAMLVRELLRRDPDITVEAYGMDALRDAGADVVFDMRDLAVMWFMAVVARLPTFVHLVYRTFKDWRDRPPDALVLVDYPGLNLLLARYAHNRGVPVIYYIPPQLWAWAPWRRRLLARRVDRVLTILPFEAEFFADAGVQATHVGHPLGDETWAEPAPEDGHVILLPGSRTAELDAHLDLFLDAASRLHDVAPETSFSLIVAREKYRSRIEEAVAASPVEIKIVAAIDGRESMRTARVAIAKSGTTTLELGLACVPSVVVYKVGSFARHIGRLHMTSPHIALVNIVAGREVVPELLISRDDPQRIAELALELYREGDRRAQALEDLRAVREQLARPGAAARAAGEVLEILQR